MLLPTRHRLLAAALVFLAISAIANPALATCPEEPKKAVEAAREALAKSDGLPRATECLIEAVDALNSKLDALIAGKLTFEGPVKAKGGFINQGDEPATEEGR